MKRKVEVFKYGNKPVDCKYPKEFCYYGIFHQFGCDYEEFENGPGMYSTAIVEKENGDLENVPVELVKFAK